MNKYVIDTNVLIASVPANSPCYWIWDAITSQEFTVCVTTEILHEYEEALARYFDKPFADYVMSILDELPNLEYVTSYFAWSLIPVDPDDNKFVDCAIAANAKCIVSEDKHFRILKTIDFPKVEVLTIEEFKESLKK